LATRIGIGDWRRERHRQRVRDGLTSLTGDAHMIYTVVDEVEDIVRQRHLWEGVADILTINGHTGDLDQNDEQRGLLPQVVLGHSMHIELRRADLSARLHDVAKGFAF